MRISDWSSDVCSSDLRRAAGHRESLDGAHGDSRAGEAGLPAHDFRVGHYRFCAHPSSPVAVGRAMPAMFSSAQIRPSTLPIRSDEHTYELQSLMRNSYAVFCLKKKKSQYTSSITSY